MLWNDENPRIFESWHTAADSAAVAARQELEILVAGTTKILSSSGCGLGLSLLPGEI
ncbi:MULTISPECIES: hypothetical protein [Parafrankia]|uniref:hypothetical protein n=1 Tax=Parafrankia TaxID=2994362 RepID=UPI000AF2BEF3|nr:MULTISPECIES: hypothetical protein [Parafrankia]MBE3205694.1 hypothetical protein [Parafrankia sp. CH37]